MTTKVVKKKKEPKKPVSPELRVIEFVDSYVLDFNASRAYGAVFGLKNEASCRALGSKYLSEVNVQQYLKAVLRQRQEQLHLDAAYVVRKLTEIVEADYTQVMKVMTYNQIAALPEAVRKLIQGVKLKKNTFENEQENGRFNSRTTEEYEVTFMSKDKALEQLGRHTGAFAKDNVRGNVDLGQMSFTDMIKSLAEIPESADE